jgi:hypothetical protein
VKSSIGTLPRTIFSRTSFTMAFILSIIFKKVLIT